MAVGPRDGRSSSRAMFELEEERGPSRWALIRVGLGRSVDDVGGERKNIEGDVRSCREARGSSVKKMGFHRRGLHWRSLDPVDGISNRGHRS